MPILYSEQWIGGHEVFDDHVADLEKAHSKEIHNGQLMMQYRIQCAEKWYNEALRVVEEESEVHFIHSMRHHHKLTLCDLFRPRNET